MAGLATNRPVLARRGRRLEYFTITWNCLEGLIGIGVGLLAGSISLVGFGIDSLSKSLPAPPCSGACPTTQTQRAGREPNIGLCGLWAVASLGLRFT